MINRELDYVIEVAECGSLLKAAEKLYISSSALSKYIQNLEKRLNVKLFDRVGKKFVLTYAGERYLYWAGRQQALLREMESELTDIANSIQGAVTVGSSLGLSKRWVRKTLKRFHDRYPKIKIHLIEDISAKITQLAIANKIDFAIIEHTGNDDTLVYHELYEETLTLISSKNNKALERAAKNTATHKYPWLPLQELSDINYIMPWPDQYIHRMIDDPALSPMTIDPIVSTKNISSIMDCVFSEIGVTITTDFAIYLMELQDQVAMYSIGERPITRQWTLLYHKDHYLTEPTKELIHMTFSDYRELGQQINKKERRSK